MRVLIAEDSAVWRRLLVQHVGHFGFDPIVAEDGAQALQILKRSDAPRLVLLDWQMPQVDGIEICRRIKGDQSRGFTYVIMLTSRDADEDMVAGLDAGADDYLTKPIRSAVLRSRLTAAKRIVEAVPPREWAKPQIPGYRVERLIGKGAFATVWRAEQESGGLPVALKIIRVDLATEEIFGRFAREIQVMKRLDHPNVARTLDSRIDDTLGFYAMELIEGPTLDRFVSKSKPKGAKIIQLVASVCDGLHYVHQQGVIHRDLKPSNIIIGQDEQPKIVDFGLSKTMFALPADDDSSTETIQGAVLGSPLFMSPEQARGDNEHIDARSDIYSVGVVLYMMLLRRHPHNFESSERWKALKEIGEGIIQPPSEVHDRFNPQLERILMRALASDRAERIQTAEEFASELRQFLRDRAVAKSAG